MFDVARGFSRRVPLARLLEIEPEIRPYLASLVVRAVHRAGDKLVVPRGLAIDALQEDEFEAHQLSLAARTYNHYGALQQMVAPETTPQDPITMLTSRMGEASRLNEQVRDLTSIVKAMQEQMQGFFTAGTGSRVRTRGMRDYEEEDSVMGEAAVCFLPEQQAFIASVED